MNEKLSVMWKDGEIEKIVTVDDLFTEEEKEDLAVLFPLPDDSSLKLPLFPEGSGKNITPRVNLTDEIQLFEEIVENAIDRGVNVSSIIVDSAVNEPFVIFVDENNLTIMHDVFNDQEIDEPFHLLIERTPYEKVNHILSNISETLDKKGLNKERINSELVFVSKEIAADILITMLEEYPLLKEAIQRRAEMYNNLHQQLSPLKKYGKLLYFVKYTSIGVLLPPEHPEILSYYGISEKTYEIYDALVLEDPISPPEHNYITSYLNSNISLNAIIKKIANPNVLGLAMKTTPDIEKVLVEWLKKRR